MDLRELVVRCRPREQAGPRSADRFDYQKDWAICRLLALHESPGEYLIAFDIFDDVVVLNSAENPDRISFSQIKTRETPPMRMSDCPGRLLSGYKKARTRQIGSSLIAIEGGTTTAIRANQTLA